MKIKNKVEQYKEELSMFGDNIEKYQYLIEKGKNAINTVPDQLKTDDWKVHGCMSQVWLVPKNNNGKIEYMSDSDAFITKGVVTIIADVYSGSTAKEIVENDLDLSQELQFGSILSGQRRNGAYNMLLKIKDHAKLWL
jgi:cysteine desulfuration protein SufE